MYNITRPTRQEYWLHRRDICGLIDERMLFDRVTAPWKRRRKIDGLSRWIRQSTVSHVSHRVLPKSERAALCSTRWLGTLRQLEVCRLKWRYHHPWTPAPPLTSDQIRSIPYKCSAIVKCKIDVETLCRTAYIELASDWLYGNLTLT